MVLLDGEVQRPPVIDYKLVDVPDLGYFATDRPHPRGELLVKTDEHVPRLLQAARSHRRACSTPTATTAPATSSPSSAPTSWSTSTAATTCSSSRRASSSPSAKLEAVFGDSPLVRQIYVYGNSARPYLLAVVVPTEEALAALRRRGAQAADRAIRCRTSRKRPACSPTRCRATSSSRPRRSRLENGLLTGIRKLAWPKLKQHYGERLEQLYTDLADRPGQRAERTAPAAAPTRRCWRRSAGPRRALLGAAATELTPDAHFTDLGGDSLSALTFANLLHEIFDVDVPVGVIVSPANDLAAIADYIEAERQRHQAAHLRRGARPGRHRGARQRPDAGQVHRRRRRWPPRRRCRGPAPRCAPCC